MASNDSPLFSAAPAGAGPRQFDTADLAWQQRVARLLDFVRDCGPCAVAFSGGVDSAVVAAACQRALGDQALAVTGVSPSLASGELEQAREVARSLGIRHEVISTREMNLAGYVRNEGDRCYFCKTTLYEQLAALKAQLGFQVIHNGTNLDDLGDYRPGLTAAREQKVRSPLVEVGFTKGDVRRLARHWDLTVWDKPALPCLASRIAFGEDVTAERLRMVDQAEILLRQLGLEQCRVRYHRDDLARIEVPVACLPQLTAEFTRRRLVEQFQALGFRFVTLDLVGFRSGSLVPLSWRPTD